jgi:hypothetical protein
MSFTLTRMALYLNLATARIYKADGSLSYITDDKNAKVTRPGAYQQETQVLYFGGPTPMLFIANNDNADTQTQMELMNQLGIDSIGLLTEHLYGFQGSVLKQHQGKYVEKGMSAKEQLLYQLAALDVDAAAKLGKFKIGKTVKNATIKADKDLKGFYASVVFVTGDYAGIQDTGNKEHAEQRLIALALKNTPYFKNRNLTVTGCKTACGTCAKALAEAEDALSKEGIKLLWRDGGIDKIREGIGLNKDDPDGVKQLDIKAY